MKLRLMENAALCGGRGGDSERAHLMGECPQLELPGTRGRQQGGQHVTAVVNCNGNRGEAQHGAVGNSGARLASVNKVQGSSS